MKVFISQPKKKDRLVKAFTDEGAELTDQIWGSNLIIPTVDEELPFVSRLAAHPDCLNKHIMVSSPETVDTCRDKAEFYRFCKRHEFMTPITMQDSFVLKPRFGKGGKGVQIIDRSMLLQEYITFPEYSVDYFADFSGNCLSVIPRRRLQVIGGECVEGKVEFLDPIIDVCKRLGSELRLIGQNTIQGWYTGPDFILNEVNCRFGGGFWITQPYYNTVSTLLELCS